MWGYCSRASRLRFYSLPKKHGNCGGCGGVRGLYSLTPIPEILFITRAKGRRGIYGPGWGTPKLAPEHPTPPISKTPVPVPATPAPAQGRAQRGGPYAQHGDGLDHDERQR